MLRILTTTLLIAILTSFSYGQSDNAYRNKNWKPKQGKYYFNQMMVYKYKNEIVDEEDDFRRSGEMVIYFDEVSGTILLTEEAYGITGEMVDFIIVEPSGKYIFAFEDVHNKKFKMIFNSEDVLDAKSNQVTVLEDFKKYLKPTNKKKTFGKNDYQWPTILGQEYIMTYERTNDITNLYMAKGKMNMNALYAFNRLNSETKLPIDLDFLHVLPEYYSVLSSSYILQGNEASYELTDVSPTEYFVDLKEYKLPKKKATYK